MPSAGFLTNKKPINMHSKQAKTTNTTTMFKALTNILLGKTPYTPIPSPTEDGLLRLPAEETTQLLAKQSTQFTSIDEICKKYSITFEWLPNANTASTHDTILAIFNNTNECIIDNENIDTLNILALYHQCVTKDYRMMKTLLQIGVSKDSTNSMVLLARYYNHIEIDYCKVTSLYKRAMKQGSIVATVNMADYYFGAGYDDDKGENMLLELHERTHHVFSSLKLVEFYNSKKRYEEMAYYSIEALKCKQEQLNYANKRYVEHALFLLRAYYSKNTTNTYRRILESIEAPNDIVLNELERMNRGK